MKRVAIFFDGKNFFLSWKENHRQWDIDLSKLADWLVRKVKGEDLFGAFYYVGVDEAPESRLNQFLDDLECRDGFFVKRFPRVPKTHKCDACKAEQTWHVEKGVDTSIVADMVRLAAVDAYDVAVLVSGDADMIPAIQAAQTFGKVVHVATWSDGLSAKVRLAAFSCIDLARNLPEFGTETPVAAEPDAQGNAAPFTGDEMRFLRELDRATEKLCPAGYVGVNYFLTKWQFGDDPGMPTPDRSRILDALRAKGTLVTRIVNGGAQALEFAAKPEFLRREPLKGVGEQLKP